MKNLTPIQAKFLQALTILSEIREEAKRQGAAFRAENNLPVARYFERMAGELDDNVSMSMTSLAAHLERGPVFKEGLAPSAEEVSKSMEFLLRYVRQS